MARRDLDVLARADLERLGMSLPAVAEEYEAPGRAEQVRHPALSVGQVRRAWQGLSDDTPIRIAAARTGVLADNGAEVLVQATGEAWVQIFGADGRPSGVYTAAVLLAGLGKLPTENSASPEGEPELSDATASTGGKVKVPAYITNALLDQLRNTVVALQGVDRSVTLTSFVQDAIVAAVKEAEDKYHGGRAFPPRRKELKTGPPIG
ncbi:hypothetical protein ACNPQN_39105 [Streptomyces sp. NPDC056297]|uniref:hypothetical protein n=1 Tax=unclassified Streptomyces TaxID=2593676 RepID=UPI0035D613BD